MRVISRILSVSVDGKPMDFRLTKLDAFSGVFLLRLLAKLPEDGGSGRHPERSEGSSPFSFLSLFSCLPDADFRSLMSVCLEHTEVLLPAGWIPVMTRGEWSYPELEHDPAVCLKLTLEEALWTLEGFFGGGGSKPPPEASAS